MQSQTLPLDETDCFSEFFLDYINEKEALKPYHHGLPSPSDFEAIIENKGFKEEARQVLSTVLSKQYETTPNNDRVTENIEALKHSKTFTITTGHQLNIFTGPLYFIYKIITVINACKRLKLAYPDYHFVPVYWMASEDHDFDEINHFYFEGKKISWDTDQTGAVGRFETSALRDLAKQLPDAAAFFEEAYNEEALSNAVRQYVNHLFGSEGLVVIDADDAALKQGFRHVMEDDLFQHSAKRVVSDRSSELEALGYKTQVNAREINFFYLDGCIRERIERTAEGFQVLNTSIRFSADELKELIKNHPEKFSPNVVLRPLYQETILPNLAYVGGPSELVYWLQLGALFEHFHTPFPLLMPRNFALVMPKAAENKWVKTGLSIRDLFLTSDAALSKWIKEHAATDLSFDHAQKQLIDLEASLKKQSEAVDTTLGQHIAAIHATFRKKIAQAEKKLLRAEKKKHTDRSNQIQSTKDILFPNGSLQERRDNFLNFYAKDTAFIQELLDSFDAFNYEMYILSEG